MSKTYSVSVQIENSTHQLFSFFNNFKFGFRTDDNHSSRTEIKPQCYIEGEGLPVGIANLLLSYCTQVSMCALY